MAGLTARRMMESEMTGAISSKPASGSTRKNKPDQGGDSARKAQEWGGGSKASKGPVTAADRNNENSSAKGR
jgi:hypothetical protein